MGDAQSAPREGEEGAAAEGESEKVDDAQTEQNIEDKPLEKNGQISEINGKADGSMAEVNGHCEDEIDAEAILSTDEEVSETEKPLKEEETPLNVEINEKESLNEADANEDVPLDIIEMDAKHNDINKGFRRFFRNIGLNMTIKRGSGEIATDVPDETNKGGPNRAEDVEHTTKEKTSDNAEQKTDENIGQETYDNDSTTCPTLTDVTSDILENAEEKTEETKDEVESDNVAAAMTSILGEHAQQDSTPKEESNSTSPYSREEEVVVSPIKRFFKTGIFSGLRKKKKPAEDETTDKEPENKGAKEAEETREQTVQEKQQDLEEISLGVEAAAIEAEHKENILKGEILSALSAQVVDASAIDPSIIIVSEPEILSSQEKDKVQASPLKRLLSGSSLKKLSKKQRGRKSSDAKLSDSGEHVSDQLLSSTGSAENPKEEGCAQQSAEAVEEEDGAWASFKKLMTPKKRIKRSSLSNEETQIPGSVEETKPSEGGQISDLSTEEGKKRKDSSVSWESVLCGSGRRRSRKTSDSEDEPLQIDKQDGGSKHGTEMALESSNEVNEMLAYSPKEAGSPSEGDGVSTWKSLKRLVTPKKKAMDEDESKDHVQSDEVTQDEYSFSIKKLLPKRKKRKTAEKQDQVSSDEADKDVASGDEDSETPAVIPLSEFDTVETEVQIQTQADIESHIPKEGGHELQQDLLDQMAESVLTCDILQTEVKKVQDNAVSLENQASKTLATNEEPADFTESISKQQLSDIPEEATPASATEEAARDDTIAEDLIEITSEAITAPEPLDITVADETEMISAVSQLTSESSKTSGNTTPVPAEYDFKETDVLLYQVVKTISISPNTVPVCSNEPRSERIAVSVSNQILETSEKEQPTILEIHRRLDATTINTSLNVEEMDAINELAATYETESMFEVNDSYSAEIVSEVLTEEFHTAEMTVDEVNEVNNTHQEDSLKELESIDESHHLFDCPSEINAAVSKDILSEGDGIGPDEVSLVKAHQAKPKAPKIDADSAATVAHTTKDGAMEQEVQTVTEKKDQIMHNSPDQIQVKDKYRAIILEDIPAAKTFTYELKEETVPLTEVNMEPEKEDEIVIDAKTGNVNVTEALDTVQASTLREGSVQSGKEEVTSEDIPLTETVTDPKKKKKQTEEHLTQVKVEPENKELKANAVKTEHVQEPQTVQEDTFSSEESSVQSLEKEITEDFPEAETVTDERKEETILLTEETLEPVNTAKTEHVQEPEVIQATQVATLDSEVGSCLSLEKEVIPENIPAVEIVQDEPKQETEVRAGPEELLPMEAAKTEHVQKPEGVSGPSFEKEVVSEDVPEAKITDKLKEETILLPDEKLEPLEASKTENVPETELLPTKQVAKFDSEVGSCLSTEKEVILEDIPAVETVTDELKQETQVRAEPEEKLQMDAAKTQHVQEPEGVRGWSLEKEVKSEDIPEATITDKLKEETILLTEEKLEPVETSKTENVQEPGEVLEAVQAHALDSEQSSAQLLEEDVPEATTTGELKKETILLTTQNLEPVDAPKTEHVQKPELLQDGEADTLHSEVGLCPSLEKEAIEDILAVEIVTDKPKQEIKVRAEPEEKLPIDAAKTRHVQEPEGVNGLSFEEEVISEISVDVPEAAKDTDEPKEETIIFSEDKLQQVDVSKTECVQEPELFQAVQGTIRNSEAGSCLSLEKNVIPEDIPAVERVTHELKQETEVKAEPEEKLTMDAAKTQHVQVPEGVSGLSLVKDVLSEDFAETVRITDEPKEKTILLTEEKLEPLEASQTEHVHEAELLPTTQVTTLDSKVGSCLSLEKEVIEDIQAVETVTDEPKQETEVRAEQEEKLPMDAAKTQHDKEPEGVSGQSLEEEVISEEVPEAALITNEPKEETILLTEAKLEPMEASETEHVQEPELFQAVQKAIINSEAGSCLSIEKKVIPEDTPAAETVTDEPKQETEVRAEPEEKLLMDAAKTQQVQEPEGVNGQSLEEEVISEVVPEAEAIKGEPKEETALLTEVKFEPVEASQTEHVQEPGEVFVAVQAPALDSEQSSVQSLDKVLISKDDPEATVTGELKGETMLLNKENLEPVDAAKTEHVREPELFQAVQGAKINSEAGSCLSLEKEVLPEDIPAVETVTDEPKQEIEVRPEPEEKQPMDTTRIQHFQEPEESSGQSLEKEVLSEDVPEAETITDQPKEESTLLTEVKFEPVEASQTEHVQEPLEVLKAVQAPALASEQSSLQSLHKVLISEDVPEKTVTGELKGETILLTKENLEPVDAAKTEHVQKTELLQAVEAATLHSEVGSCLSLENKVISGDIPAVLTVTDEPKQETAVRAEPEEKLPMDAAKTQHVQEPEGVNGHSFEVLEAIQAATFISGVDSLLLLKKEVILEDIPAVETVTNEPKQETEVSAEPEEKLPMEAAKTERVKEPEVSLSNVKEIVTESKTEEGTLLHVHVVTENIERDTAKELEKQILLKDVSKPDNVNVSIDEIDSEVVAQLDQSLEIKEDQKKVSIIQHLGVKQENRIPEDKLQTLTAVCVSSVNEEENNVLVLEKTVFNEETPAPCVDNVAVTNKLKHEVYIRTVQVSVEVEKERAIKTAAVEHAVQAQLVTCNLKDVSASTSDDLIEKTSAGNELLVDRGTSELLLKEEVKTATPSVKNEDIHRVHMQVVDVNIKSAETIVDTVQEVEVTKEVPESVGDNLEQEAIKQPDAVTEGSEMVESDTNEVEDQKVMEDNIATVKERQDDAPSVISDVSASEQQVSEDLRQTPDIPASLDCSIHDHTEDLEETKAKQKTNEAGVTSKEVKSSSEEPSPIATLGNTKLVAPQNTGIISSIGNVESPSSLSFEFKLNIQFGQAKTATERIEPVKKTELPEVRVQAVEVIEPVKPINLTQQDESQKQTGITDVAVQTTEPVANLDSTERAQPQPVLLDIGIQAMKTVEPIEQIRSTERVTSSVQATETIQPVRQAEKGDLLMSQPVLSEACEQETKAETAVKQNEEENDQDEWMDAEEDISTQEETEVSLHKVEEFLELWTESEQVEKAGLEDEGEMAPNSKTEDEESQQEMHKAVGTCGIESDDEDFAFALEHSETQTACITTMEQN